MTDPIRQKLDQICDRQSRQQFRESRGDVYKALRALAAVLDAHDDNGHGWCQGCGWNTDYAGWITRIEECRTRIAIATALGVSL